MERKRSRTSGERWKVVVDQVERLLDGALDVDAELEAEPVRVPEHLHEPRGVLAERAPVRVHQVELRRRARRARRRAPPGGAAAAPGAGRGQRLAAAGDEAPGHAVDHARVQVVVAHELLDRRGRRRRPRSRSSSRSGAGCRATSTSFLWPDRKCSSLRTRQRKVSASSVDFCSRVGDEPLVGQLAQRARAELGRGEPHGGVDVAEAARRLLHVGLAHVRRAAELPVALVALGERRLEELGEVLPVDVLGQDLAEAVEEPPVADEVPRLLHRRAAGEVRPRHGQAVGQAPHRVADLEPQVPQRVEEALGRPLDIRAPCRHRR